jgi:hypothetical protein
MKLKLPDTIASEQDIAVLAAEIKSYAKWYAHEAIKRRVSGTSSSKNEPDLSPAAREVLRALDQASGLGRQSFEQLIKMLESYAKSSPTVLITLAAPATAPVKTKLIGWCRQNIADNVLVSFKYNSTILGGLVVRYKSRVFDWSFRRQILESAHNFPEVLRRV